jgi:hypothetical protein
MIKAREKELMQKKVELAKKDEEIQERIKLVTLQFQQQLDSLQAQKENQIQQLDDEKQKGKESLKFPSYTYN